MIQVTFDFHGVAGVHQNRIRSLFERLHWVRTGNTGYQYPDPAAGAGVQFEDWLNHVVPALMLFRSYVVHHQITVPRVTIQTSANSAYDAATGQGMPPSVVGQAQLQQPTCDQFGKKELVRWMKAIEGSCPYEIP